MKSAYKINTVNTYDAQYMGCEDQALAPLGGCGDNSNDEPGLGAWECHIIVEAVNKDGEKKSFNVVFQPLERSDALYAYSGYDVTTAGKYGCDSDESSELVEFLNYDYAILYHLSKIAKKEAKKELLRLTES